MEFRELRSYVNVVEQKSFTKASEKLYLSQSTVTAHVKLLENELNVKLIERTTKSFEVTNEGYRLYRYAIDLLQLREKAVNELSQARGRMICIGVSGIQGKYIVPEILADYTKLHPDAQFNVIYNDSIEIYRKIVDGIIDLGFIANNAGGSSCTVRPFMKDELVFAMANTPENLKFLASHPTANDFLHRPFLLGTTLNINHSEIDSFFEKNGIDMNSVNIVSRINGEEIFIRSIMQGMGVAILSKRIVEAHANTKKLITAPIEGYEPYMDIYIAYKSGTTQSKNVSAFIHFLDNH